MDDSYSPSPASGVMPSPEIALAFDGLETPPAHLAIDTTAVAAWVQGRLPGFQGPLSSAKFKGGQSNPTYLISTPDGQYVLRKRPPGVLAATAHQIDREFKVLTALKGTGLPIPTPYLYCDDTGVIGTAFYLASMVRGSVLWNAELPPMRPVDRAALYDDMNMCLARLHALDFQALGLGALGSTEGYTRRNLARWTGIYRASQQDNLPDMMWLADALKERLPASEPVSLVHGDYGLHNLIVRDDSPSIAAILDWELTTIGNPLVDLAHNMRPWLEPPESATDRPSLADKDLGPLGIPTLDQYAETWSTRSRIPWSDRDFYLAFAMYRYAAMVQGVLKRFEDGTAANTKFAHSQSRVVAIACKARMLLNASR